MIPARQMRDEAIAVELRELGDRFESSRDDEGHGGSPGEWMVERMGELENEQRVRVATGKRSRIAPHCRWATAPMPCDDGACLVHGSKEPR